MENFMEYYSYCTISELSSDQLFVENKIKIYGENHHREPVVSGSPILILTFICCTITVKGHAAATMGHDKLW